MGQAGVGYVTLSDVILTSTRNGQKALKDFQVRDLVMLVPLTVQIHKGSLPLVNQVLSRDPLQDLSLRQTGSWARDRATGPRHTMFHHAHSPNSFYLYGDGNSDRRHYC